MHVFFSVGEPSGDQHAAQLIGALQRRYPGMRTSGFGGPLMQQAGCRLDYRLTDTAVMGFFGVIPLLLHFVRLLKTAGRLFAETRPDAVVLVDFPGFNWWIARKAKAAGIPVIYYMPPQLWAWASWRIRRVRKYVDLVLCALPFEYDWYASRGINAIYVGHPFFDEVAGHKLDRALCNAYASNSFCNVGLLPGSRDQEVAWNWPVMLEVVDRLSKKHPQARFVAACYKAEHHDTCRRILAEKQFDLPIDFVIGKTPEVIELADCCLMVSGSVSLEMLARGTPATVLYRVSRVTRFVGRLILRCPFITLPNLIADWPIMPEFVSAGNPAPAIDELTSVLDGWLSDPQRLEAAKTEMRSLRARVIETGANANAAEAILMHLGLGQPPLQKAA